MGAVPWGDRPSPPSVGYFTQSTGLHYLTVRSLVWD